MTGQTIAHYRLTEKIGAGGMGEVYRATDSKLHRDVAVKVISPEFARDPERMARFEREAQVLASLTHGSIAAVYGIEESAGHKAIVMELVEGEDLSERIRRGPLPIDEALRIAVRIADALEAAHDRGVIHRDLKPANIKLLESGGVKLLDFGLAKALEDTGPSHLTKGDGATLSVAATRAGVVLGTAAYMSPEQATGATADRRSDVWSFGVVLFEMLTGQRLFEGQTTSHVLAEVIRAEIDFSRLPANTPAELRILLERTLERDPRRRLRDIHDARIILERLLERGTGTHSAVQSGSATAAPRRKPGTRDLRVAVVAAVVLSLLTIAILGWMRPSGSGAPQFRLSALITETVLFPNSVGPAFDLSPDGTQIAVVAGSVNAPKLMVRRLNELDSTTLVDPGSGRDITQHPYNPFFSHDGAWIGYAVQGELRKVPATGGTPLTICKVDRSRGASWGPNDTIVFAPSSTSGLYRVSAAGGEPEPITTLSEQTKEATHRWPQVLPGGDAVLFTSHTSQSDFDDAVLEVVRIGTGERAVVHRGGSYGRYVPSGHVVFLRQNALFAVPFDLKRLAVTGPAAPVAQNVFGHATGAAHIAFASTGLLAYRHAVPDVPTHPVAWVDRDGRTTTLLAEEGTYVNPRLSPDGKKLSLTVFRNRNWDIWIYDLERRVSSRLTFDEAAETEQVWSPDGRELMYALEEAGRKIAVYRKAADGSGAPTLVLRAEHDAFPQAWSADGGWVAMVGGTGNSDIALLPLTGEKPSLRWILNTRFNESEPAFSPDGRWLAYSSSESGVQEVYIRQFPSGAGRWQVSQGGGAFPRWPRAGRELFYRTADGLMAVEIGGSGDTLRIGKPRQLFTGNFVGGARGITVSPYVFADYDVSADGSQFVMFPAPEVDDHERAGMLTLVSRWFDDLERATARK